MFSPYRGRLKSIRALHKSLLLSHKNTMGRYDNKSVKELWGIAWKYFSQYIRKKEGGICFTCHKISSWSSNHAGHFVHTGSARNWELDFNEKNVHCQCIRCNKFLSGNLAVYAENLETKYGFGIVQELNRLKHKPITPSREEAIELLSKYKELSKEH